MEAFQPSGMFRAGGQQVDAGGLNRAVAQHVREPDDVLADTIEGRGKQMPEIMGKYPRGLHASLPAEAFHLCPVHGVEPGTYQRQPELPHHQ